MNTFIFHSDFFCFFFGRNLHPWFIDSQCKTDERGEKQKQTLLHCKIISVHEYSDDYEMKKKTWTKIKWNRKRNEASEEKKKTLDFFIME